MASSLPGSIKGDVNAVWRVHEVLVEVPDCCCTLIFAGCSSCLSGLQHHLHVAIESFVVEASVQQIPTRLKVGEGSRPFSDALHCSRSSDLHLESVILLVPDSLGDEKRCWHTCDVEHTNLSLCAKP